MSILDFTFLYNNIQWRAPLLGLLALMPLLALMLNVFIRDRNSTYIDRKLIPWIYYRKSTGILSSLLSKNSAYILAWVLIGIALSGPRVASIIPGQPPSQDVDIMLVVDVSPSMQATDIFPNRLRRAQVEIEELLKHATRSKIGIVLFSARPHLFVPLTIDHNILRHYLTSLDTIKLPTNGSDPLAAINMARNELSHSNTPSAIIVVSDGDFPELMVDKSLANAERSNIPVYTLGIGSEEGGSIQIDNGEWLHHEDKPVITRLNEKNLIGLLDVNSSHKTDRYSQSTSDDSDWLKLYDHGIKKLVLPPDVKSNDSVIWNELFFWPLSFALFLLWVSLVPFSFSIKRFTQKCLVLLTYRNHKSDVKKHATTSHIFLLFIVAASMGFYPQKTVLASGLDLANPITSTNFELNNLHAYKMYKNGDYSSSLDIYKNITGYVGRFGEGACYYKLKKYNNAIRQFSLAILSAKTDNDRANALYNLGNAYFQIGYYGLSETVYKDSLLYNPELKNIQHNIKLSLALRKAVEKRLQETNQFSRAGSGPQLSPSEGLIINNPNASLAIDQSNNRLANDYPLPEIANMSDTDLEALIKRGLGKFQLAVQGASSSGHLDDIQKKLSIINARLMMSSLDDEPIELWKRLFELEEGFPASLEEPRDIPGISPW